MTRCGTSLPTARCQLRARQGYWSIIDEARDSGDTKSFSRSEVHRCRLLAATASVHSAVQPNGRALKHATSLIRSRHPDRAQQNVNPARIAVAAQPALDQGLITEAQVQKLVSIARSGVTQADFRNLTGPVLDLSQGNTEEPLDHEVLLDFYYEQAFLGRVLMFPPDVAKSLDVSGELVLSPSFLVRVAGKKPRSILNLSSTTKGVNQRLREKLEETSSVVEADPEGYATVCDMALMMVEAFVGMVARPREYDIESILGIRLAMIVMDGDAAFFRWPISADMVGLEATRVAGVTIVATCCVFGAELSAVNFSFVTSAIKALHASNLDSASFLTAVGSVDEGLHPSLRSLLSDTLPEHSHLSRGHVDDFAALEILSGRRPRASAMDLAWAIQVFLGMDGLSQKKWSASSFWSDLQKVIGAWFDVSTFSILMPRDKLLGALELLRLPEFGRDATTFSINLCASLEGKIRWATLTTPLGSTGSLIGICKQRQLNASGDRKVAPARYHKESSDMALAKFHNELLIRKIFLEAALLDPSLISCSMLSMLKVSDRLKVPGESKWLVWLSGDFSMDGNSFGVEYLDPVLGYQRRFCFVPHPPEVIAALREALAGLSEKRGYAIVSSVCERQNKLMAEFQYRACLAGRPCIVLEDNQASVACINAGYSSNVIMQTMQLASNLRQAIDNSRSTAYYTTSFNMSWHDKVSRRDSAYMAWANRCLKDAGMVQWVEDQAGEETMAIAEWLPNALNSAFPLLETLLIALKPGVRVPVMPSHGLDPAVIAQPADLSWQRRVLAAAKDMKCPLGSFGPSAYDVSHLDSDLVSGGMVPLTYEQACAAARAPASSARRVLCAAWESGSLALAALTAGMQVTGVTVDLAKEVALGRDLTGVAGHLRGGSTALTPILGADMVIATIGAASVLALAAATRALAVLWVAEDNTHCLAGAHSQAELMETARHAGFVRIFQQSFLHARHGCASDVRSRVTVAFRECVKLDNVGFDFPRESDEPECAGSTLLCSSQIASRLWTTAAWKAHPKMWGKADVKVRVLGYASRSSALVWHPAGLCPLSVDQSGGIVRTLRMRALCPLWVAFCCWSRQAVGVGGLANRKLARSEVLALCGLPGDLPQDTVLNQCCLPVAYLSRVIKSAALLFRKGGEEAPQSARASARLARRTAAASKADASVRATHMEVCGMPPKHKAGYSLYMNMNREQLAALPVTDRELLAMSLMQGDMRFKHIEASKTAIELGLKHWHSFCKRFDRPPRLRCGSLELDKAAAAQAELFILYELATFDIKASSVVAKLDAVGKAHEAERLQNPFRDNDVLRQVTRAVCKLDGPPQPKIPVTDSTLKRIRDGLDFTKRESLVVWTGLRVALAFLCRISEWGFREKHSLKWYAVTFFDKDRKQLQVESVCALADIFEVELTFFADKTHNFGEGTCRSFFAITDQTDDRCIARDLGRLWLLSERQLEHHVFSWANDTEGPTRAKVSAVLKAAAVADGIPAADISSHSLRVSGLSRLLAAGMPYESARTYGRWKSDCARRYWWPATSLAQAFSVKIWASPTFARVRGGGAIQYI